MHAVWSTWRHARQLTVVAALALAVGAAAGEAASAAEGAPATVKLTALTGPQGGTLAIEVEATVQALEHVHLRLRAQEDAEVRTLNFKNVPVHDGTATIELGTLARGTGVDAQVQIEAESLPRPADGETRGTGSLARTFVVRGKTSARLRPDLLVAAVHAPPQTLSTRAVDIVADISERNGDTGATATVKLMLGPTPVSEPRVVTVPSGETVSETFEAVKLTTPMSAELTVRISGASPFETDSTNNAGGRTIEVTEHELVRSNVLIPSLGGYGAQFNQHVYAPVTNPPVATLPDIESKVKALEPQLVRIFYNDNFEERQPNAIRNLASFVDTVQLAHEAGATINITYQAVDRAKLDPATSMARFAGVLEDLVEVRGYTNVRWVTVANEPNTTSLTMPQYETLNRTLAAELVARGLREHIRMMGGDLVRDGQRAWFQYIAANMNDVFDAYSVHIYWDYWNTTFFTESRLKDVRTIVTQELPPEARKPTYVMEFAVRGLRSFLGKPTVESCYWTDGTELARTNIAAFQQLWFDVASAQLGFTGSVKWDAYWGKYSSTYNSLYTLIGPASEGWPLFPGYHSSRLLLQTTQAGWQVLQVAPWTEDDWKFGVADQLEKEIAAYADGDDHLTLIGLDSRGSQLNTTSGETPTYSIGGLPPSAAFTLAYWNAGGDGQNTIAGTVTTDVAGVARFEVPLHAAFSLTTVPVS